MDRDVIIADAIQKKDIGAILSQVFDSKSLGPRDGYKTETELWDYKADCPRQGAQFVSEWAEICKDILAFHNNKGGILMFGIHDKSFSFNGARVILDSKLFNDQTRKFLGDKIWIEYHRAFIQKDQSYIGIAIIPQRNFALKRFVCDAPVVNGGGRCFLAGDCAYREGDSSKVIRISDIPALAKKLGGVSFEQKYCIDEPFFRVLAPDYHQFVERKEVCDRVRSALLDPRSAVASINGVGGIGKTALATWAVLESYHKKYFSFIVSITAKDRELTPSGIQGLKPTLTSFDSLLNAIIEVLQCEYIKDLPVEEKENQVRDLLYKSKGLVYVDNLETVDDARIVKFLDTLPEGVKAIVTSRRGSVRVSVHPVEPGPMDEVEAIEFIGSLKLLPSMRYATDFSRSEKQRIAAACTYSPLAIRWVLARSKTTIEALAHADGLTNSKKSGEELLEFCFRRIFDGMPGDEKFVLKVLSLFQSPLTLESLEAGTSISAQRISDALDRFEEDGLVQRLFDPDKNIHCYTIVPLGRSFVYSEVRKSPELEQKTRQRLVGWFEALDIADINEREVVRALRNGKSAEVDRIIDLALASERRGDLPAAKRLYERAIELAPNSWRAHRLLGEFFRHKDEDVAMAIKMYETAAHYAPKKGQDRAIIFRERGLLFEHSGESNSFERAIESLEVALKETPNDPITNHALAKLYCMRGAYKKAIPLLEPLLGHPNLKTRAYAKQLLLDAYEKTGEMLKQIELRRRQD